MIAVTKHHQLPRDGENSTDKNNVVQNMNVKNIEEALGYPYNHIINSDIIKLYPYQ